MSERAQTLSKDAGRPRPCRYCLSRDARRSPLRGLEWLLALLPFRPYRCRHCYQRFWALPL